METVNLVLNGTQVIDLKILCSQQSQAFSFLCTHILPATLTSTPSVCAVEFFLAHFSKAPLESILESHAQGLVSWQPPPA